MDATLVDSWAAWKVGCWAVQLGNSKAEQKAGKKVACSELPWAAPLAVQLAVAKGESWAVRKVGQLAVH